MNKTIFLITNIPTPYRLPLFSEIDRQLMKLGYQLKVYFGAETYGKHKWKIRNTSFNFEHEYLESIRLRFKDVEKAMFTYDGILRRVYKERPAAIIVNGFSVASTKMWATSFFPKPPPYIIWSEAVKDDGTLIFRVLRRFQRKLIAKRASASIVPGKVAKKYIMGLGINYSRISIGINTVDVESYLRLQKQKKKKQKRFELICVGYLVKRKQIHLLFPIVKFLEKQSYNVHLIIVGDGPEKEILMAKAKKLNIENFVTFEGYKQKEQVAEFLSKADCFLFPSAFDVWGMVLVEAMAAGLPCLASVNAGATYDLIDHGRNGFAVDFENIGDVSLIIKWLIENPEKNIEIGILARQKVLDECTLEKSAAGFIKAVAHVFNP